ncbi:hypothetical protein [Vibrio parahaemolyticus]|uniref:hypothetical protein n=1 Tax=Vibrio parahaemolyticus TaxID=670 RepID=UPI00046E61BC|nr:hypothetical protein [Vibrio parahaemolyticus]EKH9212800.1 hypothetical protein [Vibrio parahaemolyticus]MBY4653571.1 hypothetical protein [Vibrio parahaemolyticus]
MTTENTNKPSDTQIESKLPELTNQLIATCIVDHDICPLTTPINIEGKTVNAVVRKRKAVVRDRVNAVRFSIDMFDIELADAVRAFVASQICGFGTLEMETVTETDKSGKEQTIVKSAKLVEGSMVAVGADTLLDHMGIGDYTNVAYLMGKN